MKKFARTVLSLILVLGLTIPFAAPASAAAPAVSLATPNPVGASIFGGAPNVFEATAVSLDSTVTSVEVQPLFTGPPGALTAIEVFDPLMLAVRPTIALVTVNDTAPAPAGLPAGSVVTVLIEGVVTAVDRTTGEWRIGNPPVFAYESAQTIFANNVPAVGSEVKIDGSRALAGGPIVADVIRETRQPPNIIPPAGPAVLTRAAVFEGTATAMGTAQWTLTHPITGAIASFNILPATTIGPGILLGNNVIVTIDVTPGGLNAVDIAASAGPMDVMGTRAPNPAPDPTVLPAASIPAGSIAVFVIEAVAQAHDAVNGIWQVGPVDGKAYTIYESYHTALRSPNVQAEPQVGDVVRVVAVRTIAPGPLTGVVVALRPDNPLDPLFAPSADIAYFYPGTVQSIVTATDTIWTVGGIPFNTTDNVFPAAIEPGIGVGAYAVMEYLLPMANQGQAATTTAMEIFAQVPAPNLTPISPNPVIDNTPVPAGMPAGTRVGVIVSGVVSAYNPATGEWLIGSNNFPVYESADSGSRRFGGTPGVGDEVKILAFRTVAPGPVVVDITVFRTRGPLPNVTPALVETLFLYDGAVQAITPSAWTVGGVAFATNNQNFPPAIDAGLDVIGTPVTVEFQIVGGAPPANAADWIPMTLDPVTGRWRAVYNAPAVPQNWDGFILVRATDALARVSTSENAVTLLPPAATPPAAPSALVGTPNGARIDLTWVDNSTNEASFRIERARDAAFTNSLAQMFAANGATALSDSGIQPGISYFYRMFAVNGAGTSVPSNTITISPVSYTITASASANGTISPVGAVSVLGGASQTFVITPNAGQAVADVLVDGVSAGAVTAYTFNAVAANHTIAASFTPRVFTITASAGANGTITPSGNVSVVNGASQNFTITPAAGFVVGDVVVDGISAGPVSSYSFNAVTANHTIAAIFAAQPAPSTFIITASAGAGGVIAPAGSVSLAGGASQNFTITPNAGFAVAGVLVDGAPVGAVTSYAFDAVSANHTINASFVNLHTITASAGAGGAITPSGNLSVVNGANQTFTISPNAGFAVADVLVDAASIGAVTTHTFTAVAANHTISASFGAVFTITASAGANGAITPSGIVNVAGGANQSFTITPNNGYAVADVLVDGVSVGAVTTHTFNAVAASHTIAASFAPRVFSITASAGANGAIAPPGTTSVNFTANQTYTISPNAGFIVADVAVDGVSAGAVTSYTFTAVAANHTISASFVAQPAAAAFIITASSGVGGSIAPAGSVNVTAGANQSFNVTPNAGFVISDVVVDGVSAGTVTSYTFTAVNANHTISATFRPVYTITASAGANGTITPSGAVSIIGGNSQTLTITPAAGFRVADVLVDSVSVGPVATYTFAAVNANHTISATFIQQTFTITASAGPNGTITPSGAVVVNSGAGQNFTITPAAGFAIAGVTVDGVASGSGSIVTFNNVIANHTVSVSFVAVAAPPASFTVTASAGANGTISPVGAVTVARLEEQRFNITPAAGYVIADVVVDGVSVGAVKDYRFPSVVTDHTITASFAAQQAGSFMIVASAGANGSINPSGNVSVPNRANQTYTISPAAGYGVAAVVVDGVSIGPVAVYTFRDVRINHTISAAFAALPPPGVPAAPSNLRAKINAGTQVEVRWDDASNNENGFRIEKSVDGFQTLAESFVVPANTTRIVDNNVVLGNAISYRVIAYNITGDSSPSNVSELTFDSARTPENPTATVSNGLVTLSFVDNTNDETEFVVERAQDAAFLIDFTATVIPGNPVRWDTVTFTDNSVLLGTTYFYRIRARNAIDDSNPTSTVSVTAVLALPAAPVDLRTTAVSQNSVSLAWTDAATNETGYTVEKAVGGGAFGAPGFLPAGSSTFSGANLTANTTYQFRVSAINLDGSSPAVLSVTTSAPPAAPPPDEGGTAPVDGGSGGSGAGGSGGTSSASAAPATAKVEMSGMSSGTELRVDSQGKVQSNTTLRDASGKITVSIPSGSVIKDAAGTPLNTITLAEPATVPPAPSGGTIVSTREFGPSGASFDPPISISMTFDPAALPAGVDKKNLVIAFWDGMKWVNLETTLDDAANTLTVKVNHFTIFSIIARQAAVAATPAPTPEPAPAPQPAPAPAPTPVPAPPTVSEPAPVPTPVSSAPSAGLNWMLIVGLLAAAILIAGMVVFVVKRRTE